MGSGGKDKMKLIEIDGVCVPMSTCISIFTKTNWKTDKIHMKGNKKQIKFNLYIYGLPN